MSEENGNGRVTLRDVYDAVGQLRAETNAQLRDMTSQVSTFVASQNTTNVAIDRRLTVVEQDLKSYSREREIGRAWYDKVNGELSRINDRMQQDEAVARNESEIRRAKVEWWKWAIGIGIFGAGVVPGLVALFSVH